MKRSTGSDRWTGGRDQPLPYLSRTRGARGEQVQEPEKAAGWRPEPTRSRLLLPGVWLSKTQPVLAIERR